MAVHVLHIHMSLWKGEAFQFNGQIISFVYNFAYRVGRYDAESVGKYNWSYKLLFYCVEKGLWEMKVF